MQKNRSERAFSAGGVIFRPGGAAPTGSAKGSAAQIPSGLPVPTGEIEIVLVGRNPSGIWALPKGTPCPGETVEQVALREVAEETGLQTRIIASIGSVHYTFTHHTTRYDKEVRYFLMEPIGGHVSLHDTEYDEVGWFPLSEAYRRLTYETDSQIVRQAAALIRQLRSNPQPKKRA